MKQNDNNFNSIAAEYMTRQDVCDVLRISKQTLWVYTKNGTLPSYRFAGRVLYKLSDIQSSIIRVER